MKHLVVGLCLVLVTGCGGGGSSAKSAIPNPLEPTYKILSQKQLESAIVPVSDLPTGFGVDPDGKQSGPTKYYCDYKPPYEEKALAEGDFIKGGGFSGEYLITRLRQYESEKRAAAAFAVLVKTMKTCTKDANDGTALTYSVLSMPDMEDGSIGISTTPDDGIGLPQFFALVGPTLVSAGGGGLMAADADAYLAVLKKQVARYKAAAQR